MRSFHDVNYMNAYRFDCVSVCQFSYTTQLENAWRLGVKSGMDIMLLESTLKSYFSNFLQLVFNMANERTLEVGLTPAPHAVWSYINVR